EDEQPDEDDDEDRRTPGLHDLTPAFGLRVGCVGPGRILCHRASWVRRALSPAAGAGTRGVRGCAAVRACLRVRQEASCTTSLMMSAAPWLVRRGICGRRRPSTARWRW